MIGPAFRWKGSDHRVGQGTEAGRRDGYGRDALATGRGKDESRTPRRRLEGSLDRRYLDTRLEMITL